MKRFLFLFCAAIVLLAACVKTAKNDNDPLEPFIGEYRYADTAYVIWGSWDGTMADSGAFRLSATDEGLIRLQGDAWSTKGEVFGKVIYLYEDLRVDKTRHLHYYFGNAQLDKDTLRFTYTCVGERQDETGEKMPWNSNGAVTATKVK